MTAETLEKRGLTHSEAQALIELMEKASRQELLLAAAFMSGAKLGYAACKHKTEQTADARENAEGSCETCTEEKHP